MSETVSALYESRSPMMPKDMPRGGKQLSLGESVLSFNSNNNNNNDAHRAQQTSPNPLDLAASSGADVSQAMLETTPAWDFNESSQYDAFSLSGDATTSAALDSGLLSSAWHYSFPGISDLAPPHMTSTTGLETNSMVSPTAFHPAINFATSEDAITNHSHSQQQQQQPLKTISLSREAEEQLRKIAMPPPRFNNNNNNHSPKVTPSPESTKSEARIVFANSPDSADPKRPGRKRKVSSEPEEDDELDDDDKPIKKTAHNMIEKRYRTNINDKIAALRDSVPSLRIMSKSAKGEDTSMDRVELHGLTPAHKLNKATVLSKATEYIRHLEKRNTRLQEENEAMQARINAFEKLFMAGAMNGSISATMPHGNAVSAMQYQSDTNPSQQFMGHMTAAADNNTHGNEMPAGMIQVPDDMRRILAAQMATNQPYPVPQQQEPNTGIISQQQIQQQPGQQGHGIWGNVTPYVGKLMVGSLAGLMILEAVREEEQNNDSTQGRGLFAIPLQYLNKIGSRLDVSVMGFHVHTSLKALLFLGIFLRIFIPAILGSFSKKQKNKCMPIIDHAPSLSASIQVRRQAWLTSVQTVWVPRHNFFLELAALIAKGMKLSLRNIIGPAGYQSLTGFTEEQEVARVKAWSIALDSQLAGGDVEICRSRLLLTLLASGTLPDTPIRLMLKALHIRLLLWNVFFFQVSIDTANDIAGNLARSRWNAARQLNRALIKLRKDPDTPHEDELPDHLAALVEQDCDDIFSDAVIQRAHNLAFNMHTGHRAESSIDIMDAIVNDVYIASPMDAVAAWSSTEILHNVLSAAAEGDPMKQDVVSEELEVAVQITPVGSIAMLRASIARALLIDENRSANIADALQALGTERIESPFRESTLIIGSGVHASNKDLLLTMRCAVTMARLESAEPSKEPYETKLDTIEGLMTAEVSDDMTLLGFTAIMKLVARADFQQVESVAGSTSEKPEGGFTVENLAGSLLPWINGRPRSKSGITSEVRQKIIKRCRFIVKELDGIGSSDESEHDGNEDEEVKLDC